MRRILNRRGFSLIELLIVVAIIAALVGVAVPFFQDNLSEAQITKAKQDLEIIKKAISLYDAREPRPLTGTSLNPLLGRYMQELPNDPWGNPYLFDGAVGLVCSYGADALPLGSGGDTDIIVYTRPPLMITRVQYQGSWGRPKPLLNNNHSTGNKFIISLSKPASEADSAALADNILLLRDLNAQSGTYGTEQSLPACAAVPIGDDSAWVADTWESTATSGAIDPLHKPEIGVLVIKAYEDNSQVSTWQAITPTMAIDFLEASSGAQMQTGGTPKDLGPGDAAAGEQTLLETFYPGADPISPMDDTVYGTDAYGEYSRPPRCAELVNGERRGVRIEKY